MPTWLLPRPLLAPPTAPFGATKEAPKEALVWAAPAICRSLNDFFEIQLYSLSTLVTHISINAFFLSYEIYHTFEDKVCFFNMYVTFTCVGNMCVANPVIYFSWTL